MSCTLCSKVYFCNNECYDRGIRSHQVVCKAIAELEKQRQDKVQVKYSYSTNVTLHDEPKIAALVGEKCLLECVINDLPSKVLLDTGAQVSMIQIECLQKYFPEVEIHKIEDILEENDSLEIQWGNSATIPFRGWVNLTVQIGKESTSEKIHVPFLVTTDELNQTILGFNVVKLLIQSNNSFNKLHEAFESAVNQTNKQNMKAFINLVQNQQEQEISVKVKGKGVLIPAGEIVNVPCKANVGHVTSRRPMVFQGRIEDSSESIEVPDSIVTLKVGSKNYFKVPVINNSNHEIFLKKNNVIGNLDYVSSVIPLEVKIQD